MHTHPQDLAPHARRRTWTVARPTRVGSIDRRYGPACTLAGEPAHPTLRHADASPDIAPRQRCQGEAGLQRLEEPTTIQAPAILHLHGLIGAAGILCQYIALCAGPRTAPTADPALLGYADEDTCNLYPFSVFRMRSHSSPL